MAKRINVVLSQGQSNNPIKRKLEETLVTRLWMVDGVDVLVIPHLYDLRDDDSAMIALKGLTGDFILLSWLYPRAAHWILDRQDVRGHLGKTALQGAWDHRKRKWQQQTQDFRPDETPPRVLDDCPLPDRTIFHLDLRSDQDAQIYLSEIQRLASERRTPLVALGPGASSSDTTSAASADSQPPTSEDRPPARRWYPVIDYSRCTNCMECIDFCLFGVYGIDQQETILVEMPDNCRKGCPACSRVCPENAIIFPQHKTPAIAGDPSIGSEMKIDLSQLFGKPNDLDTAAQERDEHLRRAGRKRAASSSEPSAARRPTESESSAAPHAKDALDELIDRLDDADL